MSEIGQTGEGSPNIKQPLKKPKGGILDAIEWMGNKLPDPVLLFLIGTFIVLLLSHLTGARLPDGFEMRWREVGRLAGGVDEHLAEIIRKEDGALAAFTAVEAPDGSLRAHLVVEGEPVADDAGRPIDFAEQGWVVFRKTPVEGIDPQTGDPTLTLEPTGVVEVSRSLMTSNGLYWCLRSMERNFINFAPLGVVLLGMLGIGVAERSGLIAALLKTFMLVVPNNLLTPSMVFLGIMSSVGSDAGYVVLPPLAAAIYLAAGRSPLAGIAAVFAGVSAGFNANLLITTLEPIMANFSTQAAQLIDENRTVAATATWYFMAASTFVISFTGWATTALFVEKRLSKKAPEDGGPDPTKAQPPGPSPWTGLTIGLLLVTLIGSISAISMLVAGLRAEHGLGMARWGHALFCLFAVGGVTATVGALARIALDRRDAYGVMWATLTLTGISLLAATVTLLPSLYPEGIPETPLSGMDGPFQRWVAVIVPLIFIVFIMPGLVYGAVVGTITSSKDAARLMIEAIAGVAPIIVLAFFAGQFIAYFNESNLGTMLAYAGGEWLFNQGLPTWMLIVAFILLTMVFNMFVGSMSAKFALFAPIFIPMFMLIGLRPELTMVAYRIGDSVTNIITPLNAYLVIVLVFMQRYAPRAGMGTLIAMMLPYTVVFAIVWTIFLLAWDAMGLPLGVGDPVQVFAPVLE
jgi:aminobenzoyl-glutamate transport protein